jgi:hypothetical protein
MIGYGPFVAAGQPGTYSITVSWDAMQQAEPIEFENADLTRAFRAEFYDQAAHKVHQDTNVTLTCATGSACGGVCTDLMTDDMHCGACSGVCKDGCSAGQCTPAWGECIVMSSGFETCDAYCASVGEACVENACGVVSATVRAFSQLTNCEQEVGPGSIKEPCNGGYRVRSSSAAAPTPSELNTDGSGVTQPVCQLLVQRKRAPARCTRSSRPTIRGFMRRNPEVERFHFGLAAVTF